MKATAGKTYAQINAGKVHWLFTAADLPEWCDSGPFSIQVVDVTDATPMPQPGWTWDGTTFAAPAAHVPTMEDLSAAVQAHLNATANQRSYDSALSCMSYIDSTVPVFRAEATAMRDWRDAVWLRCAQLVAEAEAGKRPAPNEQELIALLPVIGWPA